MINPQTKQPFTIEETEKNMSMLAKTLDLILNGPTKNKEDKTTGFFLMVFPFGQPTGEHRANYVSNAEREDIIAVMKEAIERFEKDQ